MTIGSHTFNFTITYSSRRCIPWRDLDETVLTGKLANYVWKKRDEGAEIIDIKWEVEKQCHSYTPGSGKCDVCLTEKLSIMKNRDPRSLNKRSELMNTCLHKKSWLLTRVKDR